MVYVIQVEGNIGVGKTTLIKSLKNELQTYKNIIYLFEPIDKWTNMQDINLLQMYYKDKKKYAELFQTYAFITLLKKHLLYNFKNNDDIIICERSLLTSIHIFGQILLKEQSIRPIFQKTLLECYTTFHEDILKPNVIIYIKVKNEDIPKILKKRIATRNRKGESEEIPTDYLLKLNEVYEKLIHNDIYKHYDGVKVIEIPMMNNHSNEIDTYLKEIRNHIDAYRNKTKRNRTQSLNL